MGKSSKISELGWELCFIQIVVCMRDIGKITLSMAKVTKNFPMELSIQAPMLMESQRDMEPIPGKTARPIKDSG